MIAAGLCAIAYLAVGIQLVEMAERDVERKASVTRYVACSILWPLAWGYAAVVTIAGRLKGDAR